VVNWRVGLSFVERRVAYKPEIWRLDVQEDWRWKGLLARAKRLDVVMLEVEFKEEEGEEERSEGSEFEGEAEIEELDGLSEGKLLIVSFVEVVSSSSEVES
jgi:hypothetical protein